MYVRTYEIRTYVHTLTYVRTYVHTYTMGTCMVYTHNVRMHVRMQGMLHNYRTNTSIHIRDVLTTNFVMTMETASLSTLSPNTSMLRVGSTSKAWNMARVATGSTAEMRHPKVKLQ